MSKYQIGTVFTNGKETRKIVAIDGIVYFYLSYNKARDNWQLNPDAFYCQKPQLSKYTVVRKTGVHEYELTAMKTARDFKDKFYKKVTIINETLLKDMHS